MKSELLTVVAGLLLWAATVHGGSTNWPEFRGPTGDGVAQVTNAPIKWSETENIKWKTAIHDKGHSTPVVWNDQIWLTTATKDGHKLFAVCIDRETGRTIYDLLLFEVDKPGKIHANNTYATCSPVIEAGRIYVHFGTYGAACLDTATGKTIWSRRDLNCEHIQGPGSSPILYDNLLICHMDGADVRYLAALNKHTGKTIWKTFRSNDLSGRNPLYLKAHNTPLIVKAGGQIQLISSNSLACMSYDPVTGRELWKVIHNVDGTVVRPIYAEGLVFINAGYRPIAVWAVRPDGRGDTTDSHVAWKFEEDVPGISSPLVCNGLLYMVSDKGVVSCLNAKTGTRLWRQRLASGTYWPSPVCAAGRLYFSNTKGKTTVMQTGRTPKILQVNQLDNGLFASPAVVEGALILRTTTHLYCIETR